MHVLLAILMIFGCAAAVEYGVVIDAGSSGSRVHVYSWHSAADIQEVEYSEEQEERSEIEPGISSYADDPEKAVAPILTLVEVAKEVVPSSAHASTPLLLSATAGMRLLEEVDMNDVFAALRSGLKESSPFKFDPGYVKLLSGEEEALFGFMAVNYLLGSLRDRTKPMASLVEMGGASAQIAFKPSGEILESSVPVFVENEVFNIYGRSFLHYGQDQASQSVRANLAVAAGGADTVNHPCYLKDFSEVHEINGVNITFVGTSDAAACQEETTKILYLDAPCIAPSCSIAGSYQPSLEPSVFYAVSAFYYNVNGLGLMDFGASWNGTLTELKTAADKFCGFTLEGAKTEYPNAHPKFLPYYCANGQYVYSILAKGLKFNTGEWPEEGPRIEFVRKINGISAEWPLGAMINQLELKVITDPVTAEDDGIYKNAVIALAVVSGVLLVVIFAVVLKGRGAPKTDPLVSS